MVISVVGHSELLWSAPLRCSTAASGHSHRVWACAVANWRPISVHACYASRMLCCFQVSLQAGSQNYSCDQLLVYKCSLLGQFSFFIVEKKRLLSVRYAEVASVG